MAEPAHEEGGVARLRKKGWRMGGSEREGERVKVRVKIERRQW